MPNGIAEGPACVLEAVDCSRFVEGDEPGADLDRRKLGDDAFADDAELGRAATHVDVEHRRALALGRGEGAGAVRCQYTFVVRAGGGADELAGLRREEL